MSEHQPDSPRPSGQDFAFEPQVAGSIPVACLLHNVKILLAENLGLLLAQSLYSSVVERQSCKLKVLGSIPSGGLLVQSIAEGPCVLLGWPDKQSSRIHILHAGAGPKSLEARNR